MRTRIGLKSNGTLKVDSWLANLVSFNKGVRVDRRLLKPGFKTFGAILVIAGGRDKTEVEWKYRKIKKFCEKVLMESIK